LPGFGGVNCQIPKQSTTEGAERTGTKIEWNNAYTPKLINVKEV